MEARCHGGPISETYTRVQSVTCGSCWVQAADSASMQDEVASWEEELNVSKYADGLEQQTAHRLIPSNPAEWRCDETGITENLWLNLGTGHIGSGRQVSHSATLSAPAACVLMP